ncbi:MAG: YceI family protein [bacterium]|nr:YceI family protein [bacterium]
MKKTLLAIALIVIIILVGLALTRNTASETVDNEETEKQDQQNQEQPSGENIQAVTSAKASYIAKKGWFNKPHEEVTGSTSDVSGYISYDSESQMLTELNIEIDDQTFSTGNGGRDGDVRKMFSDAGNIVVTLAESVELPAGEFEASIPLVIEINGVKQTVNFQVQGTVSETSSSASGSADITFEQFGMDAPSAAGIFNVANDLTVEFEIETRA